MITFDELSFASLFFHVRGLPPGLSSGGVRGCYFRVGKEKKDTTATISEGYVLQGENPQKAIIILCQTRKDTDN